jgi:hypothetical protein
MYPWHLDKTMASEIWNFLLLLLKDHELLPNDSQEIQKKESKALLTDNWVLTFQYNDHFQLNRLEITPVKELHEEQLPESMLTLPVNSESFFEPEYFQSVIHWIRFTLKPLKPESFPRMAQIKEHTELLSLLQNSDLPDQCKVLVFFSSSAILQTFFREFHIKLYESTLSYEIIRSDCETLMHVKDKEITVFMHEIPDVHSTAALSKNGYHSIFYLETIPLKLQQILKNNYLKS